MGGSVAAKPQARPELLLSETSDECLVYDFRDHEAHCMNAAAYAIFRQLDGRSTLAEIRVKASRAFGAELAEPAVRTAIAELEAAGLLVARRIAPRAVDHRRRRALARLAATAGASLALPALWSIVAPTSAEAASTVMCVSVGACTMTGDCCGTPGGAAMTCQGTMCGSNGAGSGCMGLVCS